MFEEFQDGHHLGHQIGTILANLDPYASHPVSAQSDMVWEVMLSEEFQDGRPSSYLEYPNGTILSILNLFVARMPPIKTTVLIM